jgi:hypothetical protein
VAPKSRNALQHLSAAAATLIPLGVALRALAAEPRFESDLALLRGLELWSPLGDGALSALLLNLTQWLPLGTQPARAALLGAAALALLGWSVQRAACKVLVERSRGQSHGFALGVALFVTLGPSALHYGTLPSGVPGAVALAVLLVTRAFAPRSGGSRSVLEPQPASILGATGSASKPQTASMLGALAPGGALTRAVSPMLGGLPPENALAPRGALLLGALAAENWLLALLATSACVVRICSARERCDAGLRFGACLVLAFAFASVPAWHELALVRSPAQLSQAFPPSNLAAELATRHGWASELTPVLLACAALGAAVGALRQQQRPLIFALLVLAAAGILAAPHPSAGSACTLAALTAITLLAGLGAQAILALLARLRKGFSEPARALFTAWLATLVLLRHDQASAQLQQRTSAAAPFAEQALAHLPENSLVLINSAALAQRLWSVQHTGARPDLLIIPLPALRTARAAPPLLALEPELAHLIRDLAVHGAPGEFALSRLADHRPLYIDLDPTLGERLLRHLLPQGYWLRFSPHPVGRHERAGEVTAFEAQARQLLLDDHGGQPLDVSETPSLNSRAAQAPLVRQRKLLNSSSQALGDQAPSVQPPPAERPLDPATLQVLRGRFEQQLLALLAVGDRTQARTLRQRLLSVDPQSALAATIEPLLEPATRATSRFDWQTLLARRAEP